MKNNLSILLLSIFVLLTSESSEGATESITENGLLTINSERNKAFLISSNGQVEQIFPPLQKQNQKRRFAQMTVSHGQQKIAYSENNDLWVYDVVAKREFQLTHVGKPYTRKLASVEISIRQWSLDDNKILYSVLGGLTEDPEGYSPTLEVRPAKYGFYIYDLKTDRSIPLPSYIPGELIVGLVGDSDLILNFPSSGHTDRAYQGQFVRYNIGDEHSATSLSEQSIGSDFNQVHISRDGNWLTFTEYIWKSHPQKMQLKRLNLKTREIGLISTVGNFAEYQWPKMSADGEQVAYIHLKSGFYNCDLVVNGKAIYSFDGTGHFDWIDNTSIVLFWANPTKTRSIMMAVIDVKTGVVKTEQEWKQ